MSVMDIGAENCFLINGDNYIYLTIFIFFSFTSENRTTNKYCSSSVMTNLT